MNTKSIKQVVFTVALCTLSTVAFATLPTPGTYDGTYRTVVWPLTPCTGKTSATYSATENLFTITVAKLQCRNGTTEQGFSSQYSVNSESTGFTLSQAGQTVWSGSQSGSFLSIIQANVSDPNYSSSFQLLRQS